MPPSAGVLTAEFKINLVAPAAGDRILAVGRVVKAGRTLTLAQAEVHAQAGGARRLVALLTATLMAVEGRDGSAGGRGGRPAYRQPVLGRRISRLLRTS